MARSEIIPLILGEGDFEEVLPALDVHDLGGRPLVLDEVADDVIGSGLRSRTGAAT